MPPRRSPIRELLPHALQGSPLGGSVQVCEQLGRTAEKERVDTDQVGAPGVAVHTYVRAELLPGFDPPPGQAPRREGQAHHRPKARRHAQRPAGSLAAEQGLEGEEGRTRQEQDRKDPHHRGVADACAGGCEALPFQKTDADHDRRQPVEAEQ